ncbi:amidase [Ruicaihuangia caeni]|uniref:amidase n=1 Tax=Ruicaihuangia caeni TaxID=3042517 RepID=UPI00338E931C
MVTSADGFTTASDTAERVRSGATSAESVMRAAFERIHRLNPVYNAFVELRETQAMAAARRLDERIAAGESVGRLAGVPVGVKESMWEAGRRATNGSRALADFVPDTTLVTIERLLGADAIVVGRTNVPEFCYRGHCCNDLFGCTRNPWDAGRTPGGSTGGGAAAVAAGMVPVALGSDGGGSLRIPASFCGVIGYKPTFGVVPRAPGWHGWYSLNHVGPITAAIEDAALVMSVIAGPADEDPASVPLPPSLDNWTPGPRALAGTRVAFSEDLGRIRIDPEVRERFRAAVALLQREGVMLEAADPGIPKSVDLWFELASADNLASEGPLLATGLVGSDVADLITAGEAISGADYARARNAQHDYSAAWQRFLSGYDFFITPTMETVAFPVEARQPEEIDGLPLQGKEEDWCQFVYPFNLSGHPAISIPLPVGSDGLPIGVQIVAPRFHDAELLAFARAVVEAFGGVARPSI